MTNHSLPGPDHMAVGMFLNVRHVLGGAIMGTILFCSLFLTCLVVFKLDSVHEAVLMAKIISLGALAAFGQSEALNFYLKHHPEDNVSVVSRLNKIGILLTVICLLMVTVKLLILTGVLESGKAGDGLEPMLYHSEAFAFLPIIFFAVIDVLMWCGVEERREIGRVCFVIADLPILMPIAIIFILTVGLNQYGSEPCQLLIGGATSMFILVSMVLTQCTRGLLYGFSPTSSSQR